MKFEARQHINGTVAEVEAAILDDRYMDFLLQHHGVLLEAKLIDKKDDGTKVTRQARYRPKPVIPAIGPKQVPPEWFAFIESSTYDRKAKTLTFTNTPTSDKISKLLVNTGVLKLKDVGGQTERTMDGEITVKLPFFLKPLAIAAEGVIRSEGMKILENEVPVLNRFIAEVLRAK